MTTRTADFSCSCGHLDLCAVVSRVDRAASGSRLHTNPMAAATPRPPTDRRLIKGASAPKSRRMAVSAKGRLPVCVSASIAPLISAE